MSRIKNSGGRQVVVEGTGIQFEGNPDPHRVHSSVVPGQHLWVAVVCYRIADPRAYWQGQQKQVLDRENLLTVTPPGCMVCEQPWTEELDGTPCPGDPGYAPPIGPVNPLIRRRL